MYLTNSHTFTHSCLKNCDNNCVFTSVVDLQLTNSHLNTELEDHSLLCTHVFSNKNKKHFPMFSIYKESVFFLSSYTNKLSRNCDMRCNNIVHLIRLK